MRQVPQVRMEELGLVGGCRTSFVSENETSGELRTDNPYGVTSDFIIAIRVRTTRHASKELRPFAAVTAMPYASSERFPSSEYQEQWNTCSAFKRFVR
jgi:hypothetical protein